MIDSPDVWRMTKEGRPMHRTYLSLVGLLLPQLVWAGETLSLPVLLLRARDNNRDILAARHAWKVKRDEVMPTAAWPDPTFTLTDDRFPSGMAGVDPEHLTHSRIGQ